MHDDFIDASYMSAPSCNKEQLYNRKCREGNSTSLSANYTPPNSAQYTSQGTLYIIHVCMLVKFVCTEQ